MPEENWQAHGGIPACDGCHSRKVRCDRKEPCGNCVIAHAQCLRTRQRRISRPKPRMDDKIKILLQRLENVEESVLSNQATLHNISLDQIPNNGQESSKDFGLPDFQKRKRSAETVCLRTLLPSPEIVASPGYDGRDFIRKEISHNDLLSPNQRKVLETANLLVGQLSKSAFTASDDKHTWSKVATDLTPGELIHTILASQRSEAEPPHIQLHTLDHIPPKALERMALALLEETGSETELNMYKVVVHFKAALSLYASQIQAPRSPQLRHHIKQMQLHHLNAALTALDNVSFLTAPSLLLLQVLLTGAILMHILGNPTSCWNLVAHASRTLIALGYHETHNPIAQNDHEEEAYAAVAWCYHFDRCMGLLLLRPLSLPPLTFPISSLFRHNAANPMSIFALTMLEMVPIHEEILELSLNSPRENASAHIAIERLRKRMAGIHRKMDAARSSHHGVPAADYILHWESLEFKYFSTLTAVLRLSPTVTINKLEREECLRCARRALGYVKAVEEHGKQQGHFVEEYSPYLSWTILSYPLCPLFVVFCNVVGTSDPRDFQLLQEVVDSISSLVIKNKYVERLCRLGGTLLSLCKPLVQCASTGDALHHTPSSVSAAGNMLSSTDTTNDEPVAGSVVSSWDDDMMCQLWNSQPTLDWFNSDLLDTAFWDTNMFK